jgi:hypothetical protein
MLYKWKVLVIKKSIKKQYSFKTLGTKFSQGFTHIPFLCPSRRQYSLKVTYSHLNDLYPWSFQLLGSFSVICRPTPEASLETSHKVAARPTLAHWQRPPMNT